MMYRILSIDAWANCCGCECPEDDPHCWMWNNWFHIGDTNQIPKTVKEFIDALACNFTGKLADYDLEDDQCNIVLVEKRNRCPLYAIEYGIED